jgi:MFS family permease
MTVTSFIPVDDGLKSLLRNDTYRRLWIAGFSNNLVRWFEVLFVGVYVFSLTRSPLLTAIAAMMRFLPMAAIGIVSGAVAEKIGRRQLYLIVTLFTATVTAAQFMLAINDALEVWHIFVGAFVSGVHWATDFPVRRTMLGQSVAGHRVGPAMALDAAASNITRLFGPLMGGLALAWTGIATAFLVGTLLHILSFVLVYRCPEFGRSQTLQTRLMGSIAEGLRLARTSRQFIGLFLVTVLFNSFAFPVISMIPVIGEEKLSVSPFLIGVLTGGEGLGAFIGSLIIARFGRNPLWYNKIYWVGTFACFLMASAFAASPTFMFASLSLLLMGIGISGFSVMQGTLAFVSFNAESRSRLMGLLSCGIGTAPLGYLAIGALANQFGPVTAIYFMTGLGALSLAVVVRLYPEIRK